MPRGGDYSSAAWVLCPEPDFFLPPADLRPVCDLDFSCASQISSLGHFGGWSCCASPVGRPFPRSACAERWPLPEVMIRGLAAAAPLPPISAARRLVLSPATFSRRLIASLGRGTSHLPRFPSPASLRRTSHPGPRAFPRLAVRRGAAVAGADGLAVGGLCTREGGLISPALHGLPPAGMGRPTARRGRR